jgi:hypothetical protein
MVDFSAIRKFLFFLGFWLMHACLVGAAPQFTVIQTSDIEQFVRRIFLSTGF